MEKFYTYAHVDNNDQVFYIGSGKKRRPKMFHNRSEEWYNYRREHGLSEIIIFGEFDTKDEAIEEEKQFTLKMIELGQPLVNKRIANEWSNNSRPQFSGELHPLFGKTGELAPNFGKTGGMNQNFKGIVCGINKESEVICFNGEKDMNARPTKTGKFFNNGHISSVINGRIKSHAGFRNFFYTKSVDVLQQYFETATFYDEKSREVLVNYLESVSVEV